MISSVNLVENIKEGEAYLRNLIALSYEAIDMYEKKLNEEDIKIFAVLDKITDAQNEYLSFSKLIDRDNIGISEPLGILIPRGSRL